MSIRETEEYKNMNHYDACAFAEGFASEEPTREQLAASWQYIYDTGLYQTLQGWYGRNVRDLLDAGLIEE